MLVPVVAPDGTLAEWAMVELQGKMESLTGEEISDIGMLRISPQVRVKGAGLPRLFPACISAPCMPQEAEQADVHLGAAPDDAAPCMHAASPMHDQKCVVQTYHSISPGNSHPHMDW